jgi:hypothetical protein
MKVTPLLVLLLAAAPAWAQTPAAPAPAAQPKPASPQAGPAAPQATSAAPLKTVPAPQAAAPPGEVEVAPIRCWWRTDTAEIRIGQRFGVTLTCAVVETRRLKVVASINQLDPGAVQITPFEVVSGIRREDIVAAPWRYFQFDYKVRLLSEGFFGQDVNIPPLNVTYNIQASGGSQGRDQTYVLPALPVRVASLVPKDASDIRDAATEGFAAVDARRYRATNATVAGGILFALAGVLVLLAGARAFGRVRRRRPDRARSLSPAAVLHGCHRTLGVVKADVANGGGWSPARARTALAALRVAGAVGIGRTLAQTPATRDTREREGQMKLRHGLLRPRWTMLSGAATSQTIERDLLHGSSTKVPAARAALERLGAALRVCTAAGYGREGDVDSIALDAALSEATDAVRYLRRRSLWPAARSSADGQAASALAPSMSGERL